MNETQHQPPKKDLLHGTCNVAFITIGFTGCVTVLIITVAIMLGLWIDSTLDIEKQYFTFGFVVLSIPITIAAIYWVARYATHRLNPSTDYTEIDSIKEDA